MKVTGRSLHPMIGLAIRDRRVLMPSFPDAPLDLAEKIEAALPRNVVGLIAHASHRLRACQRPAALLLGPATLI